MPGSIQRGGEDDFPELPMGPGRVKDDPVFESAPGATAGRVSAAISEDFGARLHEAQERLLELRHQQEQLERQRGELEELRAKQERFLKGRVDVVEKLTKGLTRLDRDTFQTRKRLEMLDHAKQNFGKHLDAIESLNPEHWSRADLRNELVRATAALEDAELAYAGAMGQLGMGGGLFQAAAAADDDEESAPLARLRAEPPDFRYWLLAGLAFTLPLVLLGLVALALFFFIR